MNTRENTALHEVRYFCPMCGAEFAAAGKCNRCEIELSQCGWCEQCRGEYRIEAGAQCPTHGTPLIYRGESAPQSNKTVTNQPVPIEQKPTKEWTLGRLFGVAIFVVGIPAVALLDRVFSLTRLDTLVIVMGLSGVCMLLWERQCQIVTIGMNILAIGLMVVGSVLILLLERAQALTSTHVIFGVILLGAACSTLRKWKVS